MDASTIQSNDVIYYAAVSLDGCIAGLDGDVSWLDGYFIPELGFHDFMARIKGVIMGRGTFDKIVSFGKWPYGALPGAIATHRDFDRSVRSPNPAARQQIFWPKRAKYPKVRTGSSAARIWQPSSSKPGSSLASTCSSSRFCSVRAFPPSATLRRSAFR